MSDPDTDFVESRQSLAQMLFFLMGLALAFGVTVGILDDIVWLVVVGGLIMAGAGLALWRTIRALARHDRRITAARRIAALEAWHAQYEQNKHRGKEKETHHE